MSRANEQPPDPERWLDDTVRDVTSLVDRRNFLKASGLAALLGAAGTSQVGAQEAGDEYYRKRRPTVYTEEDRKNALNNIERYDWAESQRDRAVTRAERILDAYDYEDLWMSVPTQNIPRSTSVGGPPYSRGGPFSPRSGLDGFSWAAHPDDPWKCVAEFEVDGEEREITLPTNDFASYRESGLDDEGKFDPDLTDDSLLVNEEHPEFGEGWGVDDGTGFYDDADVLGEASQRWTPIAWMCHWSGFYGMRELVLAFRDAYLFTGEGKYARAGAIILDRIGDVYPDLKISESPYHEGEYPFDGYTDHTGYTYLNGYHNSHGGTAGGKFIGSIWEASRIREVLRAYDGVFPGMDGDDELVSFLDGKQEEFPGLAQKDSVGKIRENIERGFIHEILPAVEGAQIRGNFGFHQSTLAVSAVVGDDPEEYTADAIEFLFQPGQVRGFDNGTPWWEWEVTGGDVFGFLVGSPQSGYMVDEDGYPSESAPHYNTSQQNSVETIAAELRGYDGYDGADLYQNPKFKRAVDSHWQLTMLGKYTPQIANTHGVGYPKAVGGLPGRTIQNVSFALTGFDEYRTVELAQWAYMLNGLTTDGLRMDIFHPEPEGIADDIQAIVDDHGETVQLDSTQQAGYGFSALRDGENYLDRSFGTTYDTSDLFTGASTAVNDSFDESIQLEATEAGEWWEFEFEADAAGEYELDIETLFASSYGIYELYVNGTLIDTIDFYESSNRTTITRTATLQEGTNVMRWENVGKNDDSSNYKMALYYLTLLDGEAREIKEGAREIGNVKRGIYQYYGRNYWNFSEGTGVGSAHIHFDTHNLGVYGYDLDLTPELGRQGSDWEGNDLSAWVDSTIAHNTVAIDKENINSPQWVGYPRHFDHTDRVQLMDVESLHAYEQADEHRRTTAMVNVDEETSYVVDFFRVTGGDDHHFSFHAMTSQNIETEGLDLVAQDGGTYEGEDVAFTEGGPFSYLYDVERDDDPDDGFSVDWDVEDYWGVRDDGGNPVHLRLTMLTDVDDVALAVGRPAEQRTEGNPEELPFALAHREGTDLSSTFTSVIEPYEGERVVTDAELVNVTSEDQDADIDAVRAVKVDLVDGRTDYVVSSTDTESDFVVDDAIIFKGAFGVFSLRDGEEEFVYGNDVKLFRTKGGGRPAIQHDQAAFEGTVDDFTKELSLENQLEITLANDPRDVDLEDMVGSWIYVESAPHDPIPEGVEEDRRYSNEARDRRNGAFRIQGIERGSDDRATIDVGEHTLIRRLSTNDPDDGYSYSIEEGAEFVIPFGELVE